MGKGCLFNTSGWDSGSDLLLGKAGLESEPAWPLRTEHSWKEFVSFSETTYLLSCLYLCDLLDSETLAGSWLWVCLKKFLLVLFIPIASCTLCQQGKDFNVFLLLTWQKSFLFLFSPSGYVFHILKYHFFKLLIAVLTQMFNHAVCHLIVTFGVFFLSCGCELRAFMWYFWITSAACHHHTLRAVLLNFNYFCYSVTSFINFNIPVV